MYNDPALRQLDLFAVWASTKYSGPGLTNMNTVRQDWEHSVEIW